MNNGNNNNNEKTTLKVAETNPKFVGRGMALVDPRVMEEMGLSTGDVIEISGRKKSYVLLWSSQSQDYGEGLIRIDGYTRNNIGIVKDHVSKKGEKLKISLRHFEAPLSKVKTGGPKGKTRDLQSILSSHA